MLPRIWDVIQQIGLVLGVLTAIIGSLAAILELIFKPIRTFREKRKAEKDALKEAAKKHKEWQEKVSNELSSIKKSTVKLDDHLAEHLVISEEIGAWREKVNETLQRHSDQIDDSKNERRLLFKAQRATLDGLKQLGANGKVTKAAEEMDEYADENMRR